MTPTLLAPSDTHRLDEYELGNPEVRYDAYYAKGDYRMCIRCDHWFACNDTDAWVTCGPCGRIRRRDT